MNPQYAPQPQFGLPPQNFPGNRSSPSLGPPPTTQSFQNVPLGPQKQQQPPTSSPINPPSSTPNTGPPPGQFPPNLGPPNPNLRPQVPPSQLPPQGQDQRPQGFPPSQLPPPQGQDQRPPGFPPSQLPPPGQDQRPQGFPLSQLPAPGQDQRPQGFPPSQLPAPGQDQRAHGFPPSQLPPPGQDQRPPGFPPSQFSASKPPGPPGVQNGPPQFMNGPPQFQNGPPQFQNGPPHMQNGPPPTATLLPPQGQPPSNAINKPPGPPQPNQPGQGRPGQPPGQFGQPPSNNQPPFSQPPTNNQPPFNQPPPGNQPPFNHPPNIQPTFNQAAPNIQPLFNQPPFSQSPPNIQPPMSGPPSLNSQPGHPIGQPPMSGPPSLNAQPGQPPQMPGHPPLPGQNPPPITGQPPLPGQQPQSFNPGQRPNQFSQGPPGPGGPRPFNQPPLLGAHPPMPGPNQPPLPGQPPLGPNQLANQMQGMNMGPGRQYPGGTMNGDNGPHMPPALTQQQYMNGQQMRGPPAGPGYPPMPGQQPAPAGGVGSYPQPGYQQPQQARRLDPDQMPSPIQVTQDDQQNRSGIFCTNQKGLVPPLVTTNFIVQDQGNTSPRYIRSSMYNVPISQDIMKQTSVPFSLVISPMARTVDQEYPPPIVNFGDLGPVRCIRCKAYMCPFMQFIDSGRRFQCLFCKATTDVPAEYFQHLDHTGQRLDRYERPELVLGTYEFVATTEYCRNNTLPKPPAIVFVIDVSYNNVKSGLVHLLCSKIKDIIQNLPVDQGQEKSNMRVGFITYNSSVHFYNIKGNLAAPQMLIVGDIQEMFMPLLDGFLCTPEESGPVIDSLMQQIPAMFGETRETETILLPAILAGLEALKASDCAGKLMVFHSSLPTAEGPGKLKNRDDRKLLGTDKERTILTPQTQAYNQLGQDCVGVGCSVDLFLFNNAYIDVATIGQVSRLTGGEVHKYTYFQADIDGDRLIKDIITNISRPIAFDSIMRVRTSTGVRPTDFYGHFFMSNTTDMELAAIDCDKAIAVEIKHDDKLSEEEGVYIQSALLYTSCSGQRRLRVMNLSLKTCSQMADLYRNCDCDTIINYIAKQSTYKLFEHNPKAVKDSIVTRAAQILATYRKNCASPSSAGQLILPECMKLLPLYVNCLLKSDALAGGSDMTVDDRSYVMQEVMVMDIPASVNYFYPRLIPLIDLEPGQDPVEIPAPIRCTLDKMNEQGVYILENGIHMFLWIGLGAKPDFIQQVFGVPTAIQVDIDRVTLPELDNPLSLAVRAIIEEIRIQRHRCMRLTIVRQREKLEPVFKHFLAEDRGTDGSPSYVDFLIHMHKEIRGLLS